MLAGAAAGPACRTARIGWPCPANWCTLDFSKCEMQPSPNPKNLNCRSRELENRKTSSLCFLSKPDFWFTNLCDIWFSGRRFLIPSTIVRVLLFYTIQWVPFPRNGFCPHVVVPTMDFWKFFDTTASSILQSTYGCVFPYVFPVTRQGIR